jgi:hypothetical protein
MDVNSASANDCVRQSSVSNGSLFDLGSTGPPLTRIPREDQQTEHTAPPPLPNFNSNPSDDKEIKSQPNKKVIEKLIVNENFVENPMIPFAITENTTITLTLHQLDHRWSLSPIEVARKKNSSLSLLSYRLNRLQLCMDYNIAIGFVIVKLYALKSRISDFRLKKIIGCSDYVEYSNCCCTALRLTPGRYAVVPYTLNPVNEAFDYVLTASFPTGAVEFELRGMIIR